MFKITFGSGFHMTFPNGWTASVQWGPGTYSDYRDTFATNPLYRAELGKLGSATAEVAAWPKGGPLYQFSGWYDTVKGGCTPADVLAFLQLVAGLPADRNDMTGDE